MASLISLAEAKAWMQVTGTASDALILLYIQQVEAGIESYIDMPLAITTHTEVLSTLQSKYDQTNHTYLDATETAQKYYTSYYPVSSLALVEGGTIPADSYTVNTSNGTITPNTSMVTPTATYVTGYTTVTAPFALKGVALQGVKSAYQNNAAAVAGAGNVASKSLKDFSVTFGDEISSYITAQNEAVLKKYRRITI